MTTHAGPDRVRHLAQANVARQRAALGSPEMGPTPQAFRLGGGQRSGRKIRTRTRRARMAQTIRRL
jgi:hypothetical protein